MCCLIFTFLWKNLFVNFLILLNWILLIWSYKLIEVCFIAQHIVCPGEYFMFMWEECIFCFCSRESSWFLMGSQLLILLKIFYIISHFSLAAIMISFCFLTSWHDVSRVDILDFMLVGVLSASWVYKLVFHQIWGVWRLYFFNILSATFSPFLGFLLYVYLYTWWYPTGLWDSVHFSLFCFSFCFSVWIISILSYLKVFSVSLISAIEPL